MAVPSNFDYDKSDKARAVVCTMLKNSKYTDDVQNVIEVKKEGGKGCRWYLVKYVGYPNNQSWE